MVRFQTVWSRLLDRSFHPLIWAFPKARSLQDSIFCEISAAEIILPRVAIAYSPRPPVALVPAPSPAPSPASARTLHVTTGVLSCRSCCPVKPSRTSAYWKRSCFKPIPGSIACRRLTWRATRGCSGLRTRATAIGIPSISVCDQNSAVTIRLTDEVCACVRVCRVRACVCV